MNRYVLCFIVPWICFIVIPIWLGVGFAQLKGDDGMIELGMMVGMVWLPVVGFPIASTILWFATKPKQKSIIQH